ncbi:hypothetical protein BAY59_10590 [Prauserella coralliicola]|nr:hypothetical protein BAY59_10590 [Prauserella coralliicola]
MSGSFSSSVVARDELGALCALAQQLQQQHPDRTAGRGMRMKSVSFGAQVMGVHFLLCHP